MSPPERPQTDALIPRSRNKRYPKTLLVVVLGLPDAARASAIQAIARERLDDIEPVILTDCSHFGDLRAERLIFEYLPSLQRQQEHAPHLPWDLYLDRRLMRCVRKWAPVRIIAFGPQAKALIDRQRHSPFLEAAMLELLGES